MTKVVIFKAETHATGHNSKWHFKGVIEDPYKPTPEELGKRFGAGTFIAIDYDKFNPEVIIETRTFKYQVQEAPDG